MGYVMIDVVDVEYRRMKKQLMSHNSEEEHTTRPGLISTVPSSTSALNSTLGKHSMSTSRSAASHIGGPTSSLDFTTLRQMHATYLDRLLTGCLLTNLEVTSTLASIFEVCERFVAQVERWGGDILPALLFEGSLKGGDGEEVGALVKERRAVVVEINEVHSQLFPSRNNSC